MKLLIDMNLSPKLVNMLTDIGIESVHWYEIGAPNAKDTEIMAYAKEHDYIVLTCDLDFSAILSATHGQKPSVVQMRTHGFSTDKVAELVGSSILQCSAELKKGAILTIDANRARLRLLPL